MKLSFKCKISIYIYMSISLDISISISISLLQYTNWHYKMSVQTVSITDFS